MSEPTLADLLILLNDAKAQMFNLQLTSCNCTNCGRVKQCFLNTLISIDRPTQIEDIDAIMNNTQSQICTKCQTMPTLKETLETLKVQVSNKINEDYQVLSNPFIL